MKTSLVFIALLLAGCHASDTAHDHASPYRGEQEYTIKALSPEQVSAYLSGEGMGYAKAAELNSYPGPRHVLDMTTELALTAEQQQQIQAIYDAMHDEAVGLGEQIVAQEEALDTAFAGGAIDTEHLQSVLRDLGALQGELRFVHLKAHLETQAVLTQHQVHQYDQLRGYQEGGSHDHQHQM